MTIEEGHFVPDNVNDILDAMLADAREQFGDDLNDGQLSIIRTFYAPIAERLAEAQEDIGLVLSSAQIDNANGQALDFLTALIGVRRRDASFSYGEIVFSRSSPASTDYVIPRGTVIQTDNRFDPIRFKTKQTEVLQSGETEIAIPIEAEEAGVRSNLGSNTLVIVPKPPSGIEEATNPDQTIGGAERETDDELRERAKQELADGAKATAAALVAGAKAVDGVASVTIFTNDTNVDETDQGGLPDHSFELVVEGGEPEDIGQVILETKAAGDTSYSGAYGTTVNTTGTLSNGQSFDIQFSRPTLVQIYVDMDISVNEEYEGDDAVRDSIVTYLGGLLSTGNKTAGQLNVGQEVLMGEIKYAIRSVRGVYDIQDLKVGITSPPTGDSNINIEPSENATADATDGSIEITTTEV